MAYTIAGLYRVSGACPFFSMLNSSISGSQSTVQVRNNCAERIDNTVRAFVSGGSQDPIRAAHVVASSFFCAKSRGHNVHQISCLFLGVRRKAHQRPPLWSSSSPFSTDGLSSCKRQEIWWTLLPRDLAQKKLETSWYVLHSTTLLLHYQSQNLLCMFLHSWPKSRWTEMCHRWKGA